MWWIYSTEPLPNPAFLGKPGYTPDSEYIQIAGQRLAPVPERKWTQLPESFTTIRRRDWTDRRGEEIEIPVRRFKAVVDGRFAERGVIMLDHEPSDLEKAQLAKISEDLNLSWRRSCIQAYEDQVTEKQTTGHGRTKPTPYEDECFEKLKMQKPYSVESLQNQRDPGKAAAEKIAEAIAQSQRDTATHIASALKDAMTQRK